MNIKNAERQYEIVLNMTEDELQELRTQINDLFVQHLSQIDKHQRVWELSHVLTLAQNNADAG